MRIVWIVLIVLAVVVLALAYWYGRPQGPSLEEVSYLLEPRIVTMPAERVLMVTAKGNPSETAGRAFGLLMRAYYTVEGVPKGGPAFKAPRGRWPIGADRPPEEWIGRYAIPVPPQTAEVPNVASEEGMTLELTTWEYGEVAEVLHVGPYSEEGPTVEALKAFIAERGYEITGEHEEEYLKSRGLLLPGNPKDYLTIIRYPVRPVVVGDSLRSSDPE